MKRYSGILTPLLAIILFGSACPGARAAITYEITALIDTADLLMIRGSEIWWHHPGAGAAVGRHAGSNEPTVISSSFNGSPRLMDFAWIPSWPEAPPAEIRYEAASEPLASLEPALPAASLAVDVEVIDGRGTVSVEQLPDAANDWTLIVRFGDGSAGSAFLSARITATVIAQLRIETVEPMEEDIVMTFYSPYANQDYVIQSRSSLGMEDWADLGDVSITALGANVHRAVFPQPPPPRAFYRVAARPGSEE